MVGFKVQYDDIRADLNNGGTSCSLCCMIDTLLLQFPQINSSGISHLDAVLEGDRIQSTRQDRATT